MVSSHVTVASSFPKSHKSTQSQHLQLWDHYPDTSVLTNPFIFEFVIRTNPLITQFWNNLQFVATGNDFFNHVLLYNSYQSSGLLELTSISGGVDYFANLISQSNDSIQLSQKENNWRINNLRDNLKGLRIELVPASDISSAGGISQYVTKNTPIDLVRINTNLITQSITITHSWKQDSNSFGGSRNGIYSITQVTDNNPNIFLDISSNNAYLYNPSALSVPANQYTIVANEDWTRQGLLRDKYLVCKLIKTNSNKLTLHYAISEEKRSFI